MNHSKQPSFYHSCFSNTGPEVSRVHLPVAKFCNIKCNFCKPTVNPCLHGCRPGLSSNLFTPEEAIIWLEDIMARQNISLKIAGIAGPGEPLYNEETFETIELIRRRFPHMKICLSTNGLLLSHCIDKIKALDVETLTVTINAVTVKTGVEIYERVGNVYGEEGVKILIDAQEEGIAKAIEKGLVVKINTVFVPGINNNEIAKIAEKMGKLGAFIHNVIPLIPNDKFAHLKEPSPYQIEKARAEAEKYINQFNRCKRCRADAVILGNENKNIASCYA